jgi:thymidine kinase
MVERTGRLVVIAGCMFSGKTHQLIERLRAAQRAGRRVLAVKHRIDDRYDPDHLITHDNDRFDAVRATDAAELERLAANAEVIGIDEGHFFGRALAEMARRLVDEGKDVIVVGIDHDAWGRPFAPMPQLAAMADEVVHMTAACARCGAEARYSQRLVPVTDALMVGGAESYEPRCARCFEPLPEPPAQSEPGCPQPGDPERRPPKPQESG